MTTLTLDELSLSMLDFQPCCEMFHEDVKCDKPAVALVKLKCSGCEVISDWLMCDLALKHAQVKGCRHPKCGVAWYVTHKELK